MRSPETTLAIAKKLFPLCGVTRIGDITGLDRLGLPVTLAFRPNARTIAISSGKGLNQASAVTSGAMEALELFHGEHCELDSFMATHRELTSNCLIPSVDLLQLKTRSLFDRDWPEAWTLGWDLMNNREMAVPLAMVKMAPKKLKDQIVSKALFPTDSNGLASGNNKAEAILSGLYEVIERDAISCSKYRAISFGSQGPAVDPMTIPFEDIQTIIKELKSKGVALRLFDCTVDTEIPVYQAVLYDDTSNMVSAVEGFGANLDSKVAITRAITEAAQGRAVVISGARDDVFGFKVQRIRSSLSVRSMPTSEFNEFKFRNFSDSKLFSCTEAELNEVFKALRAAGVEHVVAVDLSIFDTELSFVRVWVPGLEPYFGNGNAIGNRGLMYSSLASESRMDRFNSTIGPVHFVAGGVG